MDTVLDTTRWWFLNSLRYDGDLEVFLVEGLVGEQEPWEVCGITVQRTRPVDVSSKSRVVRARFTDVVSWHVVDETFAVAEPDETVVDPGTVSTLADCGFLRFVKRHYPAHEHFGGPAALYRIHTLDDVLEVVARTPPELTELRDDAARDAPTELSP